MGHHVNLLHQQVKGTTLCIKTINIIQIKIITISCIQIISIHHPSSIHAEDSTTPTQTIQQIISFREAVFLHHPHHAQILNMSTVVTHRTMITVVQD
eukprot:TRINITY_DN35374_c0_g1_i1.p2 TRINITY_DN35374_c0_g1~~TRINITY_DN35374_c0_g1_i1.p2  ORF type:complete len:105 (-),score=28.93 TRINITY_DN35374_c0_g1_i1:124-414(-)